MLQLPLVMCRLGIRLAPMLIGAMLLGACGGDPMSPRDLVQQRIESLHQLVESGATAQLADSLHMRYSDPWHPNRAIAIRSLAGYLDRHTAVHLFTLTRSIEVDTDQQRAKAVVYVAMTGVPADSIETLLAFNADLYRFDVEFVRRDGDWLVMQARWRRADPRTL